VTTQVILINQAGIAVASDTMLSWRRGKTLPTSSKIYELGAVHKVVVLHSGASSIGGVQFETLIREWALHLPPYLATLDDYVKNFDDWLVTGMKKFDVSEDSLVEEVVRDEFTDFMNWEGFDWYHDADFWMGVDEDPNARAELASKTLEDRLDQYRNRFITNDNVATYRDLDEPTCRKMLRDVDVLAIFKERARIYNRLPEDFEYQLIDTCESALFAFCTQLLLHAVYSRESSATLNFVGFGAEEPIGGRIDVEVRSIYGGHMRGRGAGIREPGAGSLNVGIFLIAQTQTMELLVNGTNYRIWHALNEEFECVWRETEHAPSEYDIKFKQMYVDHVSASLQHGSRHAVERTIEGLNLSSLCVFADSLLRLEVLGAVSRDEVATVGGLVEVLSISRQSGAQWHRRLSPDLDHRQASPHLLG
jgi:hypothetical protein